MQKYVDAKFRITQNQTPEDALSSGTTTHHQARTGQAWPARPSLPVRCRREDGAIAYVEDGEVEINEPIAFNMEQEDSWRCTAHTTL